MSCLIRERKKETVINLSANLEFKKYIKNMEIIYF